MSAVSQARRSLRRAATPAARAVRRSVLPFVLPRVTHRWPDRASSVRVVGLLSSSSGLGMSARLCMSELARTGRGVAGANVAALYNSDDGLPWPVEAGAAAARVAIYHLNPPMLLPGILRSNPLRYLRTYNIGYWAWELEALPREWVRALDFLDAVMVPSSFCKAAVEKHTDKPVLVVPHPVPLRPGAPARDRRPGPFRVVSVFNFGSSFERKNPLAAVRAFREAFGPDGGAELVLKVSDGAKYPDDRAKLAAAIGDLGNVHVVDEVWDRARLDAFIASADAYLSLHRSEGFGLTLAEAIAADVPVVATDWSGSTDICRPDLCYSVDYDLVPVRDSHSSFTDIGEAVWADPSIAHAAAQLRRVRADADAARARAVALRDLLRRHLATRTYAAAFEELAALGETGFEDGERRFADRGP